jgi:hypothetical protein
MLFDEAARHHRRGAGGASALPTAEAVVPRQRAAGLRRETIAVNNPFLLQTDKTQENAIIAGSSTH